MYIFVNSYKFAQPESEENSERKREIKRDQKEIYFLRQK